MRTTYSHNRRGGHCPGHIRDTFLAALEAYRDWKAGDPEPVIELDDKTKPISISKAAKLVWNCSDMLPSDALSDLEMTGLDALAKRRTYASAARAMVESIER